MTIEEAITVFDNHLVFIAQRRMVNSAMLQKLKNALLTIAENSDGNNTALAADYNTMLETIGKMRALLLSCGFTPKGLEFATAMPRSFLERWADFARRNNIDTTTPKGMALFEAEERHTRQLADGDVLEVKSYRMAKTLKINELISVLRNNNSHLAAWFARIDSGAEVSDREIYNTSYEQHIERWN